MEYVVVVMCHELLDQVYLYVVVSYLGWMVKLVDV